MICLTAGAPRPRVGCPAMSPFWIWTQLATVVFVLIGMVIAIVRLV